MKKSISIALLLLADVLLYFALQVASVFVAFGFFGSGETFSRNGDNVSFVFLLIQVLVLCFLYSKRKFIGSIYLFLFLILIPLSLYIYLNYLHQSFDGY